VPDRLEIAIDFTPQSLSHPRIWNVVLYDEDGSFSGAPNSSIVSNHPMMLIGDEYQPPNWVNAYRSPHKFALSILQFPWLAPANYPLLHLWIQGTYSTSVHRQ